MILETKIARTILLSLAIILAGCVVAIVVTGWDGNSSKATAQAPVQIIETTDDSKVKPISSDTEGQAIEPPSTVTNQPQPALSDTEPTESTDQQTASHVPEGPIADGVYIEVTPAETYPGDEIQVNVKVSFNDCGISGSEIILAFDPTTFQITGMSVDGVLGSSPLVGIEKRDNQEGTLRYAVARRGSTQAPASDELLASITFKVNNSATGGTHTFALTEVRLTDENFDEITGFRHEAGAITIR